MGILKLGRPHSFFLIACFSKVSKGYGIVLLIQKEIDDGDSV